jgi:hypothetical protein
VAHSAVSGSVECVALYGVWLQVWIARLNPIISGMVNVVRVSLMIVAVMPADWQLVRRRG